MSQDRLEQMRHGSPRGSLRRGSVFKGMNQLTIRMKRIIDPIPILWVFMQRHLTPSPQTSNLQGRTAIPLMRNSP